MKYKKSAALLLLVLLGACSDGNKPTASDLRKITPKSIPVELAAVKTDLAVSYYVTTATLEPSSDAQINARTSGVIKQILHEEGDDVKAGKILLLLEDEAQALRLTQAQQTFQSSQREYNRLNKMRDAGAVSAIEWETANTNYLKAQTDLQLAELELSYTKVAAPFAGRVVLREHDRGDYVSAGSLLFRMMAVKPLLVRVHVPANRIGRIASGQSVALTIDSVDRVLQATVSLVSPIVDPATGTIKVTLQLNDYPDTVRPGDYTQVSMAVDQREKALMIPSSSLIEDKGEQYVFIAVDDKARRKKVVTGYVVDDKTEIISGLKLDDKVIAKGQRNLNDGDLLQVIDAQNQTAEQNS